MENDRESQKIMLDVSRAGKIMGTMMMIGNPAAMLLITFLKRMVQEKLLKTGEYDKIENFIKATKGNYDIINVPMAESGAIKGYWDKRNMSAELEGMGVSFSILPDLDREDGIIQIAVADKDKGKFSAWFSRHIVSQMQGGEKSAADLQNLTDGQVSIVSFPFENQEHLFREDFDRLGINYTVLPDLNVGDNEVQMYVANADLQKVEFWFGKYKDDCISQGDEVPEMKVINAEQYMNTGTMSEEQYMGTADEKIQAANEKYEGRMPGEVEQSVSAVHNQIRSTDDAAFHTFELDPYYMKITINHETLVENSTVASLADNNDYFASRIPGTWGENERTLILPKEQVFTTDEGQTYIAFIPYDLKPVILDEKAKIVPVDRRLTGEELKNQHYDPVKRKFKDKELLSDKDKVIDGIKDAGKNIIPERAPVNPIKTVK